MTANSLGMDLHFEGRCSEEPCAPERILDAPSLDGIGELISTIGRPEFGPKFFQLFKDCLQIDQCTVFAFRPGSQPKAVVHEGRSEELSRQSRELARDYVAGAFVDDPTLRDHSYPRPRVHWLRADQVQNRTYRHHFYEEARIAQKLVVLGEAYGALYYSSFYRRDDRHSFQQSDLAFASRLAQLAIQTLHRHFELATEANEESVTKTCGTSLSAQDRHTALAHLTDVLLAEPHRLSPREAAVCAAIILGYTTLGIGLNFGISVNTVATHRKRAYRKLKICSQNELFSRYFQAVNIGIPGRSLAGDSGSSMPVAPGTRARAVC